MKIMGLLFSNLYIVPNLHVFLFVFSGQTSIQFFFMQQGNYQAQKNNNPPLK